MNVIEILDRQAACMLEMAAILDTKRGECRAITFGELGLAVGRVATLLRRLGLQRGEPVLILQPMSVELYVTLLAIFKLGLVAMFVDPAQGRDHIERCCRLHPPQAFIGSVKAHLLRLISPALRAIPRRVVIGPWIPGAIPWRQVQALPPDSAPAYCEPDMPALLTFTSGSTGQPKGVVRTHRFLLAQHQSLVRTLGLRPGVIDLTTMPIVALANLASGVTSLIPDVDLRRPGEIDPAVVVRQIQTHGVRSGVASPAFWERVTEYCRQTDQTLPSLRTLFTGGAPVFPQLLDHLHQIAPHATLTAVYGSTEAEPIATVRYNQISSTDHQAMRQGRGLLTGRPVADIGLRIMRYQWGEPVGPYDAASFAAVCCSAGEAGEIVVAGAHVLSGYLNGEGDSETKFAVDGRIWHRTGDMGYLDGVGRLWLLGRCVARIEDERGVLYPFAAECALHQTVGVRRAAVVAHQGQRVAVVEGRSGEPLPDCQAIKGALNWAGIDTVSRLPKIPVDKRHNAKIDYPALRRLLN